MFNESTTGTECFDVLIEDDGLHEEDVETFQVVFIMSDLDPAVDVTQPVHLINIQDDDSMHA